MRVLGSFLLWFQGILHPVPYGDKSNPRAFNSLGSRSLYRYYSVLCKNAFLSKKRIVRRTALRYEQGFDGHISGDLPNRVNCHARSKGVGSM